MKIGFLGAALAAVAMSPWAFAHHSFAAEYDLKKPINVSGTVTKVEWENPHARFYLDIKGPDGKVENWEFEMGSPNGLMRQGWSRRAMKIGEVVDVEAYQAKDGSRLANVRRVKLPDGRRLFAGSSTDGGPQN